MDYHSAVAAAPPGWRRYRLGDLDRLPVQVRKREMARVPPEDVSALLAGDAAAAERVLRSMFWVLVYHLDPGMWDALSAAEPIHPRLLESIPVPRGRVLEVGAGSGRLTRHLARFAGQVIAVEPSAGLRLLLRGRLPVVHLLDAWAEALPIAGGSVDLTASCASFGPDAAVLGEMQRVTRPGGMVVLVSPENPDWFEAQGWQRQTFTPIPALPHDPWIDDFFGPPDPLRELVSRRVPQAAAGRSTD